MSFFISLKRICKETKLGEFQFKIVTKKALYRYGIKADDDECLSSGEKDSICEDVCKQLTSN